MRGIEMHETRMAKTNHSKPETAKAQDQRANAAVQVLPLPQGLHLFSGTAAGAVPPADRS